MPLFLRGRGKERVIATKNTRSSVSSAKDHLFEIEIAEIFKIKITNCFMQFTNSITFKQKKNNFKKVMVSLRNAQVVFQKGAGLKSFIFKRKKIGGSQIFTF